MTEAYKCISGVIKMNWDRLATRSSKMRITGYQLKLRADSSKMKRCIPLHSACTKWQKSVAQNIVQYKKINCVQNAL